jgi:hypothetical protein
MGVQIKHKANGGVDCYKARLVVKGFSQICGVDFDETYAHVTKVITIRNLLASATTLDLEIHQMDACQECFFEWKILGGSLHDATKGI